MAEEGKIPQFGAEARRELFHQRVLVLDGPLDDDNGTLIATQLLALAAEDEASDIALWIHSPGGSVPSMLAIRDIMRLIPNDVSTLALGLAASAGQFLLSAGTPGKRRADTGQPVERIFEDSLHDRWYTASQAKDYGFIDEIVGSLAEIMPRRRARVGLGVDA